MFAGYETVPAGQSGETNTKISGVFLPSADSDDGLLPDCVSLVRLCLVSSAANRLIGEVV